LFRRGVITLHLDGAYNKPPGKIASRNAGGPEDADSLERVERLAEADS